MQDDVVVPELLAFRERDRWRAFCEYCSSYHIYRALGLQQGRCPRHTPHVETGVMLINGGEFTHSKVVKYIDRKL